MTSARASRVNSYFNPDKIAPNFFSVITGASFRDAAVAYISDAPSAKPITPACQHASRCHPRILLTARASRTLTGAPPAYTSRDKYKILYQHRQSYVVIHALYWPIYLNAAPPRPANYDTTPRQKNHSRHDVSVFSPPPLPL